MLEAAIRSWPALGGAPKGTLPKGTAFQCPCPELWVHEASDLRTALSPGPFTGTLSILQGDRVHQSPDPM